MIVGSYVAEFARVGTVNSTWSDSLAAVVGDAYATDQLPPRRHSGTAAIG